MILRELQRKPGHWFWALKAIKRLTASGRRIEFADRSPFDRSRLVAFTLICRG